MGEVKSSLKRRRIFDIIQIGQKGDAVSRGFDIVLTCTIFVNIAVTFMMTFDALTVCHKVFKIIEIVTLSLFAIEYILRIYTAEFLYPNLSRGKAALRFMVSFEGVVDLFTIIPFAALSGFVVFKLLRVIRLFNLFRINATYDSFNIIILVLKDKWKQIGFSVIIILIIMLASSLGIYSIEHDVQPEAFANAFSGIWWSMSTLFTVGYGDIYPITVMGRTLAIFLVFLGVGLVAIPTGIISAGFVEQYTYRTNAGKKIADISEIGEIRATVENGFAGHNVAELSSDRTLKILLIVRQSLRLIPSESLIIEENDIIVVESERISKSAKSRNTAHRMESK